MSSALDVTISCDASRFENALDEFKKLKASSPKSVAKNLVGLRNVPEQLFRIGSNDRATAAACEVVVRLEPTDFFLGLLAALRARDWDRLSSKDGLDIIRHHALSVGCVEHGQRSAGPDAVKARIRASRRAKGATTIRAGPASG